MDLDAESIVKSLAWSEMSESLVIFPVSLINSVDDD